jgi:hypothetical protein
MPVGVIGPISQVRAEPIAGRMRNHSKSACEKFGEKWLGAIFPG